MTTISDPSRRHGAGEWELSARRTLLVAPHMSAFGGKADMTRGAKCRLLTQSGHGCRSERVPGRLRCEFEVADIGAEPQSDA
jgi:hypothetical protein